MELFVTFFIPSIYMDEKAFTEFTKTIHGFHALDIYRRSRLFIPTSQNLPTKQNTSLPITNLVVMRSATRLREAGIRFKQSNSSALNTIHFDSRCGVLTLPFITVDDSTEYEFLNMVAFEHLHAECSSDISTYVAFMGKLVDSTEDVGLLQRRRLINNGLGSHKDFVKLFNSISKEVIVDQSGSLGLVQNMLEDYCKKRRNRWCAYLKHNYFRNPWSIISVSAAAFVILLTIVSTVFSILQWENS